MNEPQRHYGEGSQVKNLHTMCFYLYDILLKAKLQKQNQISGFQKVGLGEVD